MGGPPHRACMRPPPLRPASMNRPRSPRRPPVSVSAWIGTLEERVTSVHSRAPAEVAAQEATYLPCTLVPDVQQQTLVHQRLSVRRERYQAPQVLHPQAGQLVGLIFTMLGAPTFTPAVPGLRHPNTEGKLMLLRLLWRQAERTLASAAGAAGHQEQQGTYKQQEHDIRLGEEEDQKQKADLVSSMTFHLRESLKRVLTNPLVPLEAREIACARLASREASVAKGLDQWLVRCMTREDFYTVVLPLMRHVMAPLERDGFEAAVETRGGVSSAANGDAMEQRVLSLVEGKLPAGWTLLSNAHIVALDGRHPGHHAACKWEVDLIALDETGTAVAIFEAKLANANPLMTLLTDVERCIALVDQLVGVSNVTVRLRDAEGEAYAAAEKLASRTVGVADEASCASASASPPTSASPSASADDEADGSCMSSSSGDEAESDSPTAVHIGSTASSQLRQQLKDERRRRRQEGKAAASKKMWRDVTVPIDPRLQPVYVLGRPLRRKDLLRGLLSCASAEALKIGAKDPKGLVEALTAAEASGAGDPCVGDGCNEEDEGLPDTPQSGDSSVSGFSGISTSSINSGGGGGGVDGSMYEDAPRLVIMLPQEWREAISTVVLRRLDLIADRCIVLAIDSNTPK